MVKSHLALREVAFLNELQTMGVEVFIRTRISQMAQMNANQRKCCSGGRTQGSPVMALI